MGYFRPFSAIFGHFKQAAARGPVWPAKQPRAAHFSAYFCQRGLLSNDEILLLSLTDQECGQEGTARRAWRRLLSSMCGVARRRRTHRVGAAVPLAIYHVFQQISTAAGLGLSPHSMAMSSLCFAWLQGNPSRSHLVLVNRDATAQLCDSISLHHSVLVTGNSGVNSLNTKLELNPGVCQFVLSRVWLSIMPPFVLMSNPWCPLIVMPQLSFVIVFHFTTLCFC